MTVSLPTGALLALQLAVPFTRLPVVHSVVDPTAKVTLPRGTPPDEETVAA